MTSGIFFLTWKFSTKANSSPSLEPHPHITVSHLCPSQPVLSSFVSLSTWWRSCVMAIPTWLYNFSHENNMIFNELWRHTPSSQEDRTEILFYLAVHLKPPIGPGVWRWGCRSGEKQSASHLTARCWGQATSSWLLPSSGTEHCLSSFPSPPASGRGALDTALGGGGPFPVKEVKRSLPTFYYLRSSMTNKTDYLWQFNDDKTLQNRLANV